MPRKLRVEYRTEDAFRHEYAQNIAKGGIFVPSKHQIEMREHVEVELSLTFRDQSLILPGEVVHCIPPEMAESGAQPGVAIQFLMEGEELRAKLEGLSGPGPASINERQQGTGRRVAPRSRALVPAWVNLGDDWIEGHTRNVSASGVMVILPGEPPALGCRVKVRIRLPAGGEQMTVPGLVTRQLDASGMACVGIEFQVPEARTGDVAAFMERVRAAEHTRRLGGINGPIADLGIRSVLSMFGTTAPEGMLTLAKGDVEGYIVIDHGVLRAQVGTLTGRDALDELLAWHEGTFAFEGQADETLVSGDTIPVSEVAGEGVIPAAGEAMGDGFDDEGEELVLMDLEELESPAPPPPPDDGRIDLDDEDWGADSGIETEPDDDDDDPEGFVRDDDHSLGDFVLDDDEADEIEARLGVDVAPIDPAAALVPTGVGDRSELGKTEEALLDLAAVGMTVAKAVDIIPETDDAVYAALRVLIDEGFLTLE